jgi:hypothetical protein
MGLGAEKRSILSRGFVSRGSSNRDPVTYPFVDVDFLDRRSHVSIQGIELHARINIVGRE